MKIEIHIAGEAIRRVLRNTCESFARGTYVVPRTISANGHLPLSH